MNRIQSKDYNIETYRINKILLPCCGEIFQKKEKLKKKKLC